ncbi:hypothetical protein AAHB59_13200 [Bacillus cereus]
MREMRYGLSGYLAPDGIFYECDYGKHSELANELIEKYKIKNKTNYNEIATRGEFLKFGTYPWSSKEGVVVATFLKVYSTHYLISNLYG